MRVESKTALIIPVENQLRELDPKLLLACVAAERGFPVILGSRTRVDFRIASLPRGVYLAKGMTPRTTRMFSIIRRLGNDLVVWDEEALVHLTPYHYYARRISTESLELVSLLLAWGEENAEMFRKFPEYAGTPIAITGNPRGDMIRPELRPFYQDEADDIRRRFGPFTLINTNFAMVNGFLETQNLLRPGAGPGDEPVIGAQATGLSREFIERYAAHKGEIFRMMKKLLPALTRAFPERSFILRPHPGENREPWKRIAEDHGNLRVVHERSIVPWLMTTDAVIHNGCTTGLEAMVVGVPAIAYQPIKHPDYDYHLPNRLSHQCDDVEAVCETLIQIYSGEREGSNSAEQQRLLDESLAARTGPLASDRVIDAVEQRLEEAGGVNRPPAGVRARARFDAAWRSLVKQNVMARIPGRRNNPEWQRHRFQGMSVADLQARADRLSRALGRFERVKVRGIDEHIFRIEL